MVWLKVPRVELRMGAFSDITEGVVIGAYYFDVRISTAFLMEISAFIQIIEYAY